MEIVCKCGNIDERQMNFRWSPQKIHIMVYCQKCSQFIKNVSPKENEWRVEVKKQDKLF